MHLCAALPALMGRETVGLVWLRNRMGTNLIVLFANLGRTSTVFRRFGLQVRGPNFFPSRLGRFAGV